MEKRGLCVTCCQSQACVFLKGQAVWECEEFSSGNHAPSGARQLRVKRVVSCEVAGESE